MRMSFAKLRLCVVFSVIVQCGPFFCHGLGHTTAQRASTFRHTRPECQCSRGDLVLLKVQNTGIYNSTGWFAAYLLWTVTLTNRCKCGTVKFAFYDCNWAGTGLPWGPWGIVAPGYINGMKVSKAFGLYNSPAFSGLCYILSPIPALGSLQFSYWFRGSGTPMAMRLNDRYGVQFG